MNLQNIERLQKLLSRVEQNAKRPHTITQGLGAFVAGPRPATSSVVAPVVATSPKAVAPVAAPVAPVVATSLKAVAPVAAPLPVAALPIASLAKPVAPVAATVISLAPEMVVSLPPETAASLPPDSLPADLLERDDDSAAPVDVSDIELPIEDVSLDEISGIELQSEGLIEPPDDDSGVEIGSAVTCDVPTAPGAPAALEARPVTPFTAPPSLDDLTFSEPPPPDSKGAASVEPPPESDSRNVSEAPGSIDAALLAATEARATLADARERDVPAFTPPPESGPQIAIPPMPAPAVPRTTTGDAPAFRSAAPTIEQLGEVIELEHDSGPALELAPQPESAPALAAGKATHEELEFVPQVPVPSRPIEGREQLQTLVGGFTDEFGSGHESIDTPPPPARFVVPSVGRPGSEPPVSPITAAPQPIFTMPADGGFGDEAPTASSMLAPELIARRPVPIARPVVDVIAAARNFRPQSFLELLDASIGLMKQ